ncbi:MAG: RNA repair transcriptional activator RtcR family protein [Spirochaetes bacterium]|nr:RNA repair transcriptional activator RtcR family protein [Spirochaetota bacterium]
MNTANPAKSILLSFVGNRDPYTDTRSLESQGSETSDDQYGPVLSLLSVRTFDEVVLFCTGPDYLERALEVEQVVRHWGQKSEVTHKLLQFDSVIDYEEIYHKLSRSLRELPVLKKGMLQNRSLYVLLDPGTPQIQTCWFLLARSGELPATLLQGIPPRFGGGSYRVREIDLGNMALPRVVSTLHSFADLKVVRDWGEEEPEPTLRSELMELLLSSQSDSFLSTVRQAVTVAKYADVSVMLRGEPGTGKELLARLIHEKSPRRDKPFVAVNCSALSPNLVESELFGHTKGAFTGATQDRAGKFRAADGGTILLDEIGDLPLEVQPKLLRVLQEKSVQPVGSDKENRVDVRVLAATNRDLERMLEQGAFRRDLYDRLNQIALYLPPLRERIADIPLLSKRFLDDWNRKYREQKFLSKEVLDVFYRYSWPGNIRELQNTIIALCASSHGNELKPECLPPPLRRSSLTVSDRFKFYPVIPDEGMDLRALLYQTERSYYEQALRKAGGSREKAAQLLGLNPPAFRKALKERFPDLLETEEIRE